MPHQNYHRGLDTALKDHFTKYKQVLVLLGARQVGKTTILKRLFPEAQYFLLDNEPTRKILETYDINSYRQLIGSGSQVVILDEIHTLTDPGRAAKILYDQVDDLKLIITGSSSLSVKNKTTESLAGRKIDYLIYPLTFSEYLYQKGIEPALNTVIADTILREPAGQGKQVVKHHNFDLKTITNNVLLYGLYPALVANPSDRLYLQNLVDSVVFKDLLELKLIEHRSTALTLLKLLAYQVGNLVNYSEIGGRLNIDARTVKRYIDIFEQSFILFRLYPFSTNQRDELGKTPKIYFYDLGLRNALVGDFSHLSVRGDAGALWENFIVCEFLKINQYASLGYTMNYWRLKQGSEMDLVLSKPGGELVGVEIKSSPKSVSSAFINRYPKAKARVITRSTFYS